MPGINGIARVELSVRDLDKSVRGYCELLGAQDVFRATNDAYRITACASFEPRSKLVLAFTQHREEEPSEFDPRRAGLDHAQLPGPPPPANTRASRRQPASPPTARAW